MIRALLHRFLADSVLEQTVLGASVEEWILFGVALAASAVLVVGVRWAIRVRLRRDAGRPSLPWAEQVVDTVLERTRGYFLAALALYLAARVVGWDERGLGWTASLLTIAALLQAGRWITGLITLWMARYRAEKLQADASAVTSMQALGVFAKFIVWAVIVLMLLDNVGVNVTTLVAGLGIGGIAIGLALQNILGDLFASLSIVLDKPFVIGDSLTIGADSGTVEHIGLKSTRIRSLSGEQIVFSNGDLLSSRVRNYQRMTERRVVLSFGVTYDTPHATLATIPGLVRTAVDGVRADPESAPLTFDRAHFKGFGASSLDFEAVYHVLDPDYGRYMDAQQAVDLALIAAFEAHNIAFASPTRTIRIEQPAVDIGADGVDDRDAKAPPLSAVRGAPTAR